MERAGTSGGERTPLVQPTYVFESSLTRRYKKRLRNLQCAICLFVIAFLGIALLVTVSYNLSTAGSGDEVTTEAPGTPAAAGNLTATLTSVPPDLAALLKNTWPLKGKSPPPWAGPLPSAAALKSAISHGETALQARSRLESLRRPLQVDSPAGRAQRAAATARAVKPLADLAYATEQATRALINGTESWQREGGVGVGPATNASWPAYCLPAAPACPAGPYRTFDGTCNNLAHPTRWGVAGTPFRRVLPPAYGDGISSPRAGVAGAQLPSARDVSVTVHRPSYAHDSVFTVMLAVWGQFIDHDITATALSKGENSSLLSCCDATQAAHPECFPVALDEEDPFYQQYNLTCMEFVRSAPAPTCHFGPREQMNQATAFLDGSVVYGYDGARAARLRAGAGGGGAAGAAGGGGKLRMLRVGSRELLPPSTDPDDGCNTAEMNAKGRYCFESGDDRANENLHLTTMHLLWARQHNRLAARLARLNPRWGDERLYQEARRIVGAQMQHITYAEFLPAVLGEDVMHVLNLTLKSDGHSNIYNPHVDPSIANHFSAAAFRFAHTLLPGLIHNVNAANGTVSFVHLHEMLFNPYQLYQPRGSARAVRSALDTPVHGADPHVTDELSNHLFERPRVANVTAANSSQAAVPPHPCGLDLVSLNIQRGRDHGLPPYPAWRELCGFPRPASFEQLTQVFDEESMGRISKIYTHVDDIDLYTGALAEAPRGRLLGPTMTCLLADQFLRLKVADRFWYETGDAAVAFTLEQLTELRKTTLASVICANEELLDSAQPRVMQEAGGTNPLVDCMELPQPDLAFWKETAL